MYIKNLVPPKELNKPNCHVNGSATLCDITLSSHNYRHLRHLRLKSSQQKFISISYADQAG